MRTKKLAWNTLSPLVFQICAIVCGFILPRLVLLEYGSEVNGLVNSLTEFLSFISVLELGVGAVVISALYKPLAEKNENKVSEIITSGGFFFKRIGQILLVYVFLLIIFYPVVAKQEFGYLYTGVLIASMSISFFAQYYYGVVDRLLLLADQKGYIQYNAQTITLIINTLLSVILISRGFSIQIVKLVSSVVYLARPYILRRYVNKHYNINRHIQYDEEPIKQKWNGIAQHVCTVVLDETDIIILSIMSSLSAVSIYSVYYLVVAGVKKLFLSLTFGIEAILGEMWAKKQYEDMITAFKWVEWSLHTVITFVFGCTASLIVPFISVYTNSVNDANYIQPLFGGVLVLAHAIHCYRLPYNIMIKATGMYKETQSSFICATIINVSMSIFMVRIWGLIGVAFGTLLSMLYQTIWMIIFNSKRMIKWPIKYSVEQILLDGICIVPCYYICSLIQFNSFDMLCWVILALKVSSIWFLGVVLSNALFRTNMIKKVVFVGISKIVKKNSKENL